MNGDKKTNWERIHERLDAVRAAVDAGSARSAEEERRILQTRARELARAPDDGATADERLEVVEFDLASERYGIALMSVREVCLARELTPVPCTPPFVLGIINLRGEIRTVIDIKKFFALPEQGITDLNKILLVQHEGWQLGLLADRIRGVRMISTSDLQPAPPTLTGIRAAYLRGVTSDRLIVLDAARILADDRLLVHEEVET